MKYKKNGGKFTVLVLVVVALILLPFGCKNSAGGGTPGGGGSPSGGGGSPSGGENTGGGVQTDVTPPATTYIVTFNANDDSAEPKTATQPFTLGTEEKLSANTFERTGYAFAGWNTAADGSGEAYNNGAKYTATKDITLYAIWATTKDFVRVIGGTVVGDEKYKSNYAQTGYIFVPGRTVTIKDFWMSDHEVTQSEYESLDTEYHPGPRGNGWYKPEDSRGLGGNFPIYYVSWYDAIIYCNLRSMAEGLEPCYSLDGKTNPKEWGTHPTDATDAWDIQWNPDANGYRLPTEAEWEYAARGGNNGIPEPQNKYAGSDTVTEVAWFGDGSTPAGNASGKAHEVKKLKENKLNLYDMSGNVREWCWDWSGSVSADTLNTGVANGSERIQRGGSWHYTPLYTEVATRQSADPAGYHVDHVGFRIVRNAQ